MQGFHLLEKWADFHHCHYSRWTFKKCNSSQFEKKILKIKKIVMEKFSKTNHRNSEDQSVSKRSSSKTTAIQIDEAISKTSELKFRFFWKFITKISIHLIQFNLDFGLFNYVIICVSATILYAVAAEISAILYVIPVSECDLKLNLSQKGILASAGFLGVIFSSHLWGYLGDTIGRRRIIQPTLFAAFSLTIICSFVQDFYVFTVLRFLNGFLWVNFIQTSLIFDSSVHSLIIPYSIYQYLACLVLRELYTLIWVNFTTISKEVAP